MRIYRIARFELHADVLALLHEGRPVGLGPKVVETLLALAERAGEPISKTELLDRIWPQGFVTESNLAQNIYVLRKTLRAFGGEDPIETLPGCGYRLKIIPEQVLAERTRSAPPLPWLRAATAAFAVIIAALAFSAMTVLHTSPPVGPSWSAQSQQLYVIGRYYWNLRTRAGVTNSLHYFERVIDVSPTDPRGYAAMADANVAMGDYCYGTHKPSVYYARAREYAEKALTLDPNSAEAHASLGFVALHEKRVRVALVELQRAIRLDRSYPSAHEWYGIALLQSAQLKRGTAQLELATHLDPLSVSTLAWLASASYTERKYREALVYSRMALEIASDRPDVWATIAHTYAATGDRKRSAQAMRHLISISPYAASTKHHAPPYD